MRPTLKVFMSSFSKFRKLAYFSILNIKKPQPTGFLDYGSETEKVIVDHRALLFSGGICLIGKFWIFHSFALFY